MIACSQKSSAMACLRRKMGVMAGLRKELGVIDHELLRDRIPKDFSRILNPGEIP